MEPDVGAYTAVMEEIKRRTKVIDGLLHKQINVMYEATHIESMVLQVRMITELVALASLAANKSIFEENRKKFENHWHPKKILKDVESLNPNFYPQPIVEVPLKNSLVVAEFVNLKTGYMTRDELVQVHGKCGNLLHARNPFRKGVGYGYYEKMVPKWRERIRNLLNIHLITPLGYNGFYRVWMEDLNNGRVGIQPFQRVEDTSDV